MGTFATDGIVQIVHRRERKMGMPETGPTTALWGVSAPPLLAGAAAIYNDDTGIHRSIG
jgi:hypothetical protein